jgi:hypothetical protein
MHLARRDVEVDAVEGDDVAEALADRACTNGRRRPTGSPGGRRAVTLFGCCPK